MNGIRFGALKVAPNDLQPQRMLGLTADGNIDGFGDYKLFCDKESQLPDGQTRADHFHVDVTRTNGSTEHGSFFLLRDEQEPDTWHTYLGENNQYYANLPKTVLNALLDDAKAVVKRLAQLIEDQVKQPNA